MERAPAETSTERDLWQSERLVTELVGRLIEFWGFKRNMGRVWAILYLSPQPLSAVELREKLQLSAGAVSMTLTELGRWGAVRRVWVPGERKDFFSAELQLWKMVSRVMNEREGAEINAAVEACEAALSSLESELGSFDPSERRRAELQRGRIQALLSLARLGRQLLDALLSTAKLDAEPLSRVELSEESLAAEGTEEEPQSGSFES